MDKSETTKSSQVAPNPAEVWRAIAQQALQGATVLGVIGLGIRVISAIADASQRRAAPPIPERVDEDDEEEETTSDLITVLEAQVAADREEAARQARQAQFHALFDREARNARELLGVTVLADADEIRRALRHKLADSRLHPDQGGDGDEAARLIAAKNLLIERLGPR